MRFDTAGRPHQLTTLPKAADGREQPGEVNWIHGLAVAADGTLYVGDTVHADVRGARAAGMATIHFRTGRWRRQRPRNAAETPDEVVTDVAELEAAIVALLNGPRSSSSAS